MLLENWTIWLILAALLFVGEIFTAGFFLLWFSLAALVASLTALAGFNLIFQWFFFVLIAAILFIFSKRLAERFSKKQPTGVGADRMLDREGVVLKKIDPIGKVKIDSDIWSAKALDGKSIDEKVKVIVKRVEGTHLLVQIKEEG